MRKLLLAITLALAALPLAASDGYRFHIRLTDARTAFQADPTLKMSAEELERAAQSRVMLVDHGTGAHWRWIALGLPSAGSVVPEQGLNARGAARLDKDPDLGLTPSGERSVRIRCLRDGCDLGVTTSDGRTTTKGLKKSETAEVPFDSDVEVAFH